MKCVRQVWMAPLQDRAVAEGIFAVGGDIYEACT